MWHPVGEIVVQHQRHRFGVVHDPLDLAPRKRGIEGDGREPALLGGQLPAQHVDVVGQRVGEDVARPEAPGPQPVHQLVGASGQLGERQRDPRWTRHYRRLIRVLLGEIPESEPPIPRVLHGE